MKPFVIAAGFLLGVASAAQGQDALDDELWAIAARLSKDAASAKLADLLRTPEGLQAVRERIDTLLNARAWRVERDPQGFYEDFLFAPDADGALRLRPDRKDEFERLRLQVARAPHLAEEFYRRCNGFAKKIADGTDLDKRAKAAWRDSGFQLALFHRHAVHARALEDDDLVESLLTKALERGKDGKLHVGGPHREEVMDLIRRTYGHLDAVNECEKAYLAFAAKEGAAVRQAVTSEAGQLFVLGRLIRQLNEGCEETIGVEGDALLSGVFRILLEEPPLLPVLAVDVQEAEKMSEVLKARFEKIRSELAGARADDLDLSAFLKNDRARLLMAERVMALKRDRHLKIEADFDALIQDGFEANGEAFSVKKSRYDKDENGPTAAYEAELQAVLDEFNGMRSTFDLIAERCAEPEVVELYENRAGTFLLQEHLTRVAASLAQAARSNGLGAFTAAYLAKEGDAWTVRPARHPKIEQIAARAAQIKIELQAREENK